MSLTYLGHGNNFAIIAPAPLLEELWNLGGLARAGLTNNNSDGKCFNQIEQPLAVLCYWKKR